MTSKIVENAYRRAGEKLPVDGNFPLSNGDVVCGLTDALTTAYAKKLQGIIDDTQSSAGELKDQLVTIQKFMAINPQLPSSFKELYGKALVVANRRALQDKQSYDSNYGGE